MTRSHLAAVGIALAALTVIAWESSQLLATLASNGHLADAGAYQAAVNRWVSGESPYSDAQLSGPHTLGSAVGGGGFVYPPSALPLFLPLMFGVEVTLVWVLMTHLAFLVVVYAIARRELSRRSAWFALVPVAAAVALPGMSEIRFGNASALVATLVGLMWLLPRHAPLLAVVAGAVKVFPLAAAIWALRWRPSLIPATLLGAGLIAVTLMVDPAHWWQWGIAMASAVPSCPDWALVSLPCATGSSLPGVILAAVLFLGALAAPTRSTSFLLLTVAMVTPSPDLYQHYTLIVFIGVLPIACSWMLTLGRLVGGTRAVSVEASA